MGQPMFLRRGLPKEYRCDLLRGEVNQRLSWTGSRIRGCERGRFFSSERSCFYRDGWASVHGSDAREAL